MITEHFTVIAAMAHVEGWGIPGDIPTRDDNPGDIMAGAFATREGATGTDAKNPRFATFATPEAGFQAMRDLLNGHAYAGMSIHDMLNKYAPSSENDTSNYESIVCKLTGLSPNTILTPALIG